ncbi:MAG: PD40 domain-containing protein [Chloroflexi bacterium]|nr:PD40 domain-containing protein [Chloroflexota bacterium]
MSQRDIVEVDHWHATAGRMLRRRRGLSALFDGLTTLGVASLAACAGPVGPAAQGGATTAGDNRALPLVYGSEGNIYAIGIDGKMRRQLTKVAGGALARDPAWSPDGKRIAYSLTPPMPAVRGPGGLVPLPVTDVYVMNADGANANVLISHGAPGVGYESPVWSPDGQALYVTYTEIVMESNVVSDQVTEVARVPLGGGQRQTLATNAMLPAIAPDGKRLAYVTLERDGQALIVADAGGKNARPVVPKGRFDVLGAPRFSPDGNQVVFSTAAPMPPVPTVTPVTPRATPERRSEGGSSAVAQARTPALAAASLRPSRVRAHGLPMDLFVVGVDGAGLKRLTVLGEDNPAAEWSPDGKKLAMLAGGGVYVLDADGSGLTTIHQQGGHGLIDWRW